MDLVNNLEQALTSFLRSEKKSKSYSRADEYNNDTCISNIVINGNEISANIKGTRRYKSNLTLQGTHINAFCSCPVEFDTCKHCIALALYTKGNIAQLAQKMKQKKSIESGYEVKLKNLAPKELVSIINNLINSSKNTRQFFILEMECREAFNKKNKTLPVITKIFKSLDKYLGDIPLEYDESFSFEEGVKLEEKIQQSLILLRCFTHQAEQLDMCYRKTIRSILEVESVLDYSLEKSIKEIVTEHVKVITEKSLNSDLIEFIINFISHVGIDSYESILMKYPDFYEMYESHANQ